MQSEKSNSDPNRIAKVAEILGLMEEAQKKQRMDFSISEKQENQKPS